MRWTDLKECCDYYNINYKSLCTYMQKNKISKEEALSHYYQYYKYNRFTYNHVTYDSFAACCMAYEIKPICVRRYAKRKHFLLRHALSSYLNYHNKRKIYFCGQEYITFTSCCRAFGCKSYIGHIKVNQLQPTYIQKMVNELFKKGYKRATVKQSVSV